MLAVWGNDGSFKVLAELPDSEMEEQDEDGEEEDGD